MKLKKCFFAILALILFISCENENQRRKNKKDQIKIGQIYNNNLESDKKEDEAVKTISTEDLIDMGNKGIGPVKNVSLGKTIDPAMAKAGQAIFDTKCMACHRPHKKLVGPAPEGILKRRSPEWIMNMIMNPNEMTKKDPIAKQLVVQNSGAIMADMSVGKDEARELLEYFRTLKKQS